MIYGHSKTIHGTQHLNVEVDKRGHVVSVWFRCMALPFKETVVDNDRAQDMNRMSGKINGNYRINAIDIDTQDPYTDGQQIHMKMEEV